MEHTEAERERNEMKKIAKTYTITSPALFCEGHGIVWEKDVDDAMHKVVFGLHDASTCTEVKTTPETCHDCLEISLKCIIARQDKELRSLTEEAERLQKLLHPAFIAPNCLRGKCDGTTWPCCIRRFV